MLMASGYCIWLQLVPDLKNYNLLLPNSYTQNHSCDCKGCQDCIRSYESTRSRSPHFQQVRLECALFFHNSSRSHGPFCDRTSQSRCTNRGSHHAELHSTIRALCDGAAWWPRAIYRVLCRLLYNVLQSSASIEPGLTT